MLGDIRNVRLLYFKAALMLLMGSIAGVVLLVESPTIRTAILLAIAIWGFCRAYYFAFYVIEHYADPQFKFAGIIDFAKYAMKRKKAAK